MKPKKKIKGFTVEHLSPRWDIIASPDNASQDVHLTVDGDGVRSISWCRHGTTFLPAARWTTSVHVKNVVAGEEAAVRPIWIISDTAEDVYGGAHDAAAGPALVFGRWRENRTEEFVLRRLGVSFDYVPFVRIISFYTKVNGCIFIFHFPRRRRKRCCHAGVWVSRQHLQSTQRKLCTHH